MHDITWFLLCSLNAFLKEQALTECEAILTARPSSDLTKRPAVLNKGLKGGYMRLLCFQSHLRSLGQNVPSTFQIFVYL